MFNTANKGIDSWFSIRELICRVMKSPTLPVLILPDEINTELSRMVFYRGKRPSLENTQHALFVLGYVRDTQCWLSPEIESHFFVYPYYSLEVIENLGHFTSLLNPKEIYALGTKVINDRFRTHFEETLGHKMTVGSFEENKHVLQMIA